MTGRRLRVMIDGRMLMGRFSGVGRFVTRLVDELVGQDGIEVVVLGGCEMFPTWRGRGDMSVVSSSFDRGERTASRRVRWEVLHLRGLIRRAKVDVYHATWNTGVPAGSGVPAVLTIHDLIPWHDPKRYFSTALQRACYRYTVRASARRAAIITTVSEYVRRDVLETLGLPPERVVAIHNGVEMPPPAMLQGIPRGRPYVLYVGGLEHRKNIAAAFAGMACYWQRFGGEVELRLTGQVESLSPDAAAAYRRLGNKRRVRFLGRLDEAGLGNQYAGARLLLMLSRDEGFGLPVLEAMAYGCPVVAACSASLPEVVGDAGVLVEAQNPSEVADAVHRIMTDPAHRDELVRRGRTRAGDFGWDVVAARMRDIYERLACHNGVLRKRLPAGPDIGRQSGHAIPPVRCSPGVECQGR